MMNSSFGVFLGLLVSLQVHSAASWSIDVPANGANDANGLRETVKERLNLIFPDVAAAVEVHFENKDSGFFLRPSSRSYYPTANNPLGTSSSSSSGSILSIDKFTVFQTSEPASVRATYGPFSTKQTIPARYIVPDPLETLPGPQTRRNITTMSNALLMDAQELGARHLDITAHLVGSSISRDSPVLRVLFHAGSETGGRRQLLLARHQRVCVLLHAMLDEKIPLTATCSPDGAEGVCLAQITIPADWWPPLPSPDPSGRFIMNKTPLRHVKVSYTILEPRTVVVADDSEPFGTSTRSQAPADLGSGCRSRIQIQPRTILGEVPLVPNRTEYIKVKADNLLMLFVPHKLFYPGSRFHVPAFLYPQSVTESVSEINGQEEKEIISQTVTKVILSAVAQPGVRILDAASSSSNWTLSTVINKRNTLAKFIVKRKEGTLPSNTSAEEIMTILLEASEESDGSSSFDNDCINWTVEYTREGDKDDVATQIRSGRSSEQIPLQRLSHHHHHHHHHHLPKKRSTILQLEIQKDDIQAVLPISKNWVIMNTAILTGRQVSQPMKVFIVSQAGTVAEVTLQSTCHSEDETILKVSSSCSSVYVDGSEMRGSINASIQVKYGTFTGLARFTVWIPEPTLEVTMSDVRLSQIKGWKVPEGHPAQKNKRSLNRTDDGVGINKRRDQRNDEEDMKDIEIERLRADDRWDTVNSIDRPLQTTCRLRFQQSSVEVYTRFSASESDSGRNSYFINRRTWLRVTDLVVGLLRISDLRIATFIQDRIVQGRSLGRTEVQVLSPITGKVIGHREIRVVNDRVSIAKLSVKAVSGLQLTISPDSVIENGYIAETSVTRKLTAQYQEGLLDINLEFSDGTKTPLRDIAVSDYHLVVESLDPEVVAFAPMVASHHPRVIAVGEGRGDLLRVTLQLSETCRALGAGSSRRSKGASRTNSASPALATAAASVEVDFASSDLPHRPEFVQNDGGGTIQGGSSHHHRERKTGREIATDLQDILRDQMGGVVRHQNAQHMSPLQIGLYVLLAAFCFAIVVFVISCVVYANKFKPHPSDSPTPSLPMLGAVRARAASQRAAGRRPRESTTNAHDWVWLGRATLERAACAPQQVRVTNNPLAGEADEETVAELGTSFDNPNHIELPTTSRAPTAPIDTTTYFKRDKPRSFTGAASKGQPAKGQILAGAVMSSPRNGNANSQEGPPPLPPHGVLPSSAGTSTTDASNNNNNEDYKPPVPPHRNTGVNVRLSETPKKHSNAHRSNNSHHGNHRQVKHHHHHHSKNHSKPKAEESTPSCPAIPNDEEFVELRNNHEDNKESKCSREIKRATIVGNPMFSSSSSSSSASSTHETEEPVALDDLNLGMDYNQIMQYFDNLKESNA